MRQLYLQPGNKLLYDINFKDDDNSKVEVCKIDTEEDGEFWNKLPVASERMNIQLCFRNYISPHITVAVTDHMNTRYITYIFGCLIERNGIEEKCNYIFKLSNAKTQLQPMFTLEPVLHILPSTRLNYGICTFEVENKPMILLIGGNTGAKNINDTQSANKSLHSTSLLFDVESNKFDKFFKLDLPYGKDCITAVVVGERFVYSFFGRKASQVKTPNVEDPEIEHEQPIKRYEYCTEIDRWEISKNDNNIFERIKIKFDEKIEKCLKPLIIPIEDHSSFLIIGGIKGNQIPITQIGRLDITGDTEGEVLYPVVEEEKKEEEEEQVYRTLDVPLSFVSNNFIHNEKCISAIGLNASGRAWLFKADLENDKYTVDCLL